MTASALRLICLALACSVLTACVATNLSGEVSPNVDLSSLKSFYVVRLEADRRGIEKLIADALRARGYEADSGEAGQVSGEVDAIVNYRDRWQWEITMYMLELNIEIRDPETRVIMAYGNSFRTSLAREKPEFMVNEVLTRIFDQ